MPFYDIYNKCYLGTFFVFAVIETLICSGITYGWASMVVVFKLEHFYLRLCRPFYAERNWTFPGDVEIKHTGHTSLSGPYLTKELPGCPKQESIFNLIFTISIFCLSGIKFPSGVFIDRCGPRIARSVGGALYIASALGMGFITIGYEDILFPVFVCICMGGSLLVISVYQVCNVIYRNTKSQVICILHGGFDSSAVVLLIFKELYENGVDLRYISLMYGVVCAVLILLGTFVLIPTRSTLFHWIEEEREMGYQNFQESIAGPDFAVSSVGSPRTRRSSRMSFYESVASSLYGGERKKSVKIHDETDFHMQPDNTVTSAKEENEKLINQNETTPLLSRSTSMEKSSVFEKDSVLRSIFSSLYLAELIFLATFQLKLWYFVGSLPDNLGRLSHNNKATVSHYISVFGYIQFGGILVTPVIGVVFDRDSFFGLSKGKPILTPEEKRLKKLKQCIAPFAITIMLCIIFSILALFEDLRFQIPQYVLYTTVRGFVYANHGSYMAVAFPPNQFGTLYGLGIFIAGCVGLFEYALFELTNGPLQGDPYYTNVILLILVLFSNLHTLNLWRYCRAEERRLKKLESP